MTGRFDGKRIVAAAVTTWLVSIPTGAFTPRHVRSDLRDECRGLPAGPGDCAAAAHWVCRRTDRITGRRGRFVRGG